MKKLRERIGELAREKLQIEEPMLKQQYDQKLALLRAQDNARQKAIDDMKRERERLEKLAATQPFGPPG